MTTNTPHRPPPAIATTTTHHTPPMADLQHKTDDIAQNRPSAVRTSFPNPISNNSIAASLVVAAALQHRADFYNFGKRIGCWELYPWRFSCGRNGGWCMHDEAAAHYIDMIDQTTLGHRFIKAQFNVTPRIGWQIDPFGHSAVQAYLLGAEVGFDSIFFGRIDYQDRSKRKNEKGLEVIWQGSKSLGSSAQDDMSLFDYNVQERVNDFVAAAYAQANITRTNHVMWTMGTDFKYQYAESWFRNLDKLIHYVNEDGRVNALYSTPSIYTDAKYAETNAWPLKADDFFSYADKKNAYWTGYFTNRPAFKGYIRSLSGYYLAARQLEFLKGRNKDKPNRHFG